MAAGLPLVQHLVFMISSPWEHLCKPADLHGGSALPRSARQINITSLSGPLCTVSQSTLNIRNLGVFDHLGHNPSPLVSFP